MAKKKYYAVANGRVKGIFDNWDACKMQVVKFSGAQYKGFDSYDKAKQYMKEAGVCEYSVPKSLFESKNDTGLHKIEFEQNKTAGERTTGLHVSDVFYI